MTAEFPIERYRQYLILLARVELFDNVARQHLDDSDLVQQTMLEAHQQRQQFRGQTEAEFKAWLRQILARNLADTLRQMGRAKRDVARQQSLEAALEHSSARLDHWLASEHTSPSQAAERAEQSTRLADALASLPEAQRTAIVLHHWHQWPLAGIAQHLDRSPAAVAGLLKRGLKQLRVLMAEPE